MNSRFIALASLVAIVLLQACSSMPVDDLPPFVAQQRAMALAEQGRGELASALDHWRIVRLAAPEDLQASQQISELEGELEKKAASAYRKGLAALKSGRNRRAEKYFVAALAAQPADPAPLQQLRKIKSLRMNTLQHDKSSKRLLAGEADKNQAYAQGQQSVPVVDERLRSHVRRVKAYLAADQLFQADAQYQHAMQMVSADKVAKAQLAGLSDSLAESYYQHARRLMRSDLDKAIEYLQISLRYEPGTTAQNLLRRSRLIRDKLTKIQGASGGEKNN